jgi:hypothetical protein
MARRVGTTGRRPASSIVIPCHLLASQHRRGSTDIAAAAASALDWRAVICPLRMAGGQCPLKGGAIDHHRCHEELVNQLTTVFTN